MLNSYPIRYNYFDRRLHLEGFDKPRQLFCVPFLSYEIWAAAVGAAMAVAGTAYTLSGAGTPASPDLASSSRELSNANAQMLPIQRQLQAAAQSGGSVTIPLSQSDQKKKSSLESQIASLTQQLNRIQSVPEHANNGARTNPNRDTSRIQAQIDQARQQLAGIRGETVDFAGLGEADIKAKLADAMAKSNLALQQKYDSQFIDQALEQEKLADPEGFAARSKEMELIQQQMNHPENPINDLLNKQVGERLKAGRGLDDFDKSVLDDAVAKAQASRGGSNQNPEADFSMPLTTGLAGDQRQLDTMRQATGWLSSGATPEDVNYRHTQQDLSNLSNFSRGRTPESEFSGLSSAQRGATPQNPGSALPLAPTNQGAAAGQAAVSNYSAQLNQPTWLSGISALLSAGNSVANSTKI